MAQKSVLQSSGNQICRFCLQNSENFIDIFEDKLGQEVVNFLEMYHNFTIDSCNFWAKNACMTCIGKIESFRTLCQTIRKSEETLKEICSASRDCQESDEAVGNQEEVMIGEFFSLTCDLCKKVFQNSGELRLHFRREHNRRWYIVCCKVKHRDKKNILEHLWYHMNPDVFKCPHCLRQFMTQVAISRHVENRHTPEKRVLMCDICHKTFALKSILKIHIRKQHQKRSVAKKRPKRDDSTVKAEDKCICEICGQVFDLLKKLRRHSGTHTLSAVSSSAVQNGFKCEKCDKVYKNRQALYSHVKKHNAYGTYRCKECGKVSPTPTALRKHIKDSHTLTRDFVCHICSKGFKRKTVLREHIATHTGEYLYSCDFCPKEFRAGASKSQHMRRDHPEMRGSASSGVETGVGRR